MANNQLNLATLLEKVLSEPMDATFGIRIQVDDDTSNVIETVLFLKRPNNEIRELFVWKGYDRKALVEEGTQAAYDGVGTLVPPVGNRPAFQMNPLASRMHTLALAIQDAASRTMSSYDADYCEQQYAKMIEWDRERRELWKQEAQNAQNDSTSHSRQGR